MSDEIFFDRVQYTPASFAARTVVRTRDYIARLCKDEKVPGRRVGKNWYVDLSELKTFLAELELLTARRREEMRRERTREYQAHKMSGTFSEPQFIDGVKYIAAADAAQGAGLTRDYVGRLCREKKINGLLAGSVWYVDAKSLQAFLVTQSYEKTKRHEQLAKKRSQEYRRVASARNFSALQNYSLFEKKNSSSLSSPEHKSSHVEKYFLHSNEAPAVAAYRATPVPRILTRIITVALVGTLSFGTYALIDPTGAREAIQYAFDNKSEDQLVAAPTVEPIQKPDVTAPMQAVAAPVAGAAMVPSVSMTAHVGEHASIITGVISHVRDALASVFSPFYAHTPQDSGTVAVSLTPYPMERTTVNTTTYNNYTTNNVTNNNGGDTHYQTTGGYASAPPATFAPPGPATIVNNITNTDVYRDYVNLPDLSELPYYLAISGGTLTGLLNISASGTSTFSGGLSLNSLNVSGTATSTFAQGVNLTDGCFAIDGNCIVGSGGVAAGGSDGQMQFNDGGVLGGGSHLSYEDATGVFTFCSITGTAATPTSFFTQTSSSTRSFSNTSTIGSLTAGTGSFSSTLNVSGLSTLVSGFLSVSSSTIVGDFITTGTNIFNGASNLLGLGTFGSGFVSQASSTVVGLLNSTRASTTQFTNTGSTWLTGLTNALLATDPNGLLVSTTSISTGLLTGVLGVGTGGTGLSSYSTGDVLYASGANTLAKLPIGIAGQVLKVSGGIPSWGADNTSGGASGLFATTTDSLAVYPSTVGYVVLVGTSATSTTGNILEVKGNALFRNALVAYDTISAPSFFATSTSIASTFAGGYVSQASSTVVGLLSATKATTTQLTNTGSTWFTNLASALLATDQNGLLVSTTTIGAGLISGSLGTINSTVFNRGDSITVTAASSTLLANSNTWSGVNAFSSLTATNATTTNLHITSLTSALLATDANGRVVSTTSIGAGLLSGVLGVGTGGTGTSTWQTNSIPYYNGTRFTENTGLTFDGTKLTATYASSTYLTATTATSTNFFSNAATIGTFSGGIGTFSSTLGVTGASTFTGLGTFTNGYVSQASSTVVGLLSSTRASTTQLTNTGSTWFTGLTNALLSTDQNGLVVSTTTIGAGFISGSLGTINSTAFNRGDSITITAASSTLLANVNTWTGLNTFANATTT